MFSKPINQTQLFGFDDELKKLTTAFDNNKLTNKIILSGYEGIGKSTFAYHFINYIFSINEEKNYNLENKLINPENKSYKLIEKKAHPNLFIIELLEDKNTIDISQIREMIKFSNKSSFNNKIKIVLIDNVEYLNLNSANSLLKILEDANSDLFFILIHNTNKKILETIKSRCINFKMFINKSIENNIINQFIKEKQLENLNSEFHNFYTTHGQLIKFYNFCVDNGYDYKKINLETFLHNFFKNKSIKDDPYFKKNLSFFFEIFFYNEIKKKNINFKIFNLYKHFIKKVNLFTKYNLDIETLFIDFSNRIINEK